MDRHRGLKLRIELKNPCLMKRKEHSCNPFELELLLFSQVGLLLQIFTYACLDWGVVITKKGGFLGEGNKTLIEQRSEIGRYVTDEIEIEALMRGTERRRPSAKSSTAANMEIATVVIDGLSLL